MSFGGWMARSCTSLRFHFGLLLRLPQAAPPTQTVEIMQKLRFDLEKMRVIMDIIRTREKVWGA